MHIYTKRLQKYTIIFIIQLDLLTFFIEGQKSEEQKNKVKLHDLNPLSFFAI